jgi:Uma2 family endonuclease
MSTVTDLVTADELLHRRDDGFRYELVRGELKKMPPAGGPHGNVANNISWSLTSVVKAQSLGRVFAAETGFRIATKPDTVRAPDVAFVSRARIEKIGVPEGYWPGAPDLAVEVISPGDTFSEVEEKVLDWLAAGCRMVIVLDPRKHTASVYRGPNARLLTADDTLSGEDVVPGWSVQVSELFE